LDDDDDSLPKLLLSRWTAFRRRNNSSCNWRCCYFGFPLRFPIFFFGFVVLVASKIYSDFFSGPLAAPPRPSGHQSSSVMNFYCDGAFGFTSRLPLPANPDSRRLRFIPGCCIFMISILASGREQEASLLLPFILMALPRAQINITHFWPTSTSPRVLVVLVVNLCMVEREYSVFPFHMSHISKFSIRDFHPLL